MEIKCVPAPIWKLDRCEFQDNRAKEFTDMIKFISVLPEPDKTITISFLSDKSGVSKKTIKTLIDII